MSRSPDRLHELATSLAAVERRIELACGASGRSRADLTLVVVTKTFPASDVRLLAQLGVRDVGESRDQEARPKAQELADLDLCWHFVGRLQSNKARSVGSYAGVVQSLDRPSLVPQLAAGAQSAGRPVEVLVQISLDADAGRGGVTVPGLGADGADGADQGWAHLRELLAAVDDAPALVLRGVMGVAPRDAHPAPAFAHLIDVAAVVRAEHAQATWVSAGMSGDLEAAISAGATHLRVGSAILGSRGSLR